MHTTKMFLQASLYRNGLNNSERQCLEQVMKSDTYRYLKYKSIMDTEVEIKFLNFNLLPWTIF